MFKIGQQVVCIKEDNFIENFGFHTSDCPKVDEIVNINEISANGRYLGFEGYDSYNYRADCFRPLQDNIVEQIMEMEFAQ